MTKNQWTPARYTHEGNRPDGPAPTSRATSADEAGATFAGAGTAFAGALAQLVGSIAQAGEAIVAGFAGGLDGLPPISERARDYQHARIVASLTWPWAPPLPGGTLETFLGALVQEGPPDG